MRTDHRFFYAHTISAVFEEFGVVKGVTKPLCNFANENSSEHIVWMAVQVVYLNVHQSQNENVACIWIKRIQLRMQSGGFWDAEKVQQLLLKDTQDGFNHYVPT